ncbi:MAG: hypothetical protein WC661_12015 [Opitutaceae bacterium]|jgi:poly(3-hydroxybutyrate) depolymerase
MRLFLTFFLLAILGLARLSANTDERDWSLESGGTLHAELIRYEEATGKVTLKFNNAGNRVFDIKEFSVVDRAWLTEWLEFEESLDAKLKTLGGRVEHLVTAGVYPTDLFVYYPSRQKTTAAALPGLILFHPGGKAGRYLKRHLEAAEATGFVLVACGSFRNEKTDAEDQANQARFREVFPQILQRVRVDPARLFLGGTSGGGQRAFQYSAMIKHPWAGIYSNGGWLGGAENYNLPYPSGMRIAMVNGNQDAAANHYVKPDSNVLIKAGNTVGVIVFEGGHQEPPVHSQIQAFNWLLGQNDTVDTEPSSPKG